MLPLINEFLFGLLIFIRITAVLFTVPLFSSASVPVSAKLMLGLALTYIIYFTIKPVGITYDAGLGIIFMIAVKEAITGMILGFSLHFVFYSIAFAAMQMGMDMGLNMAAMFDPATEIENNVLGQIFGQAAVLIFLIINGHHFVIRGLAVSFSVIPLGHFTMNESVYLLMLKASSGMFVAAIKIAAPIMVAFFLLHTAVGIISRIIPQMQVFFVVQPVQLGLGLALLASGMPLFLYIIKYILEQTENSLYDLIKVMGY